MSEIPNDRARVDQVRAMFAAVAGRYDFCNRLLSFRRDVYWRRQMVKQMRFFQTNRYLDLACGTADVALQCVKDYPEVEVVALDFVPEMVDVAEQKITSAGMSEQIKVAVGDATCVDYPDNSFDSVGIAFGIRNIPDREKTLREMRRLVVPGGRIVVLELTMPEQRLVRMPYAVMLRTVMPMLAALFTGNRSAYKYLGESILAFPSSDKFVGLMRKAGLQKIETFGMTFGVCRIFRGEK